MSLLLDALKRAEQEKLARSDKGEAAEPAVSPVVRAAAAALELQPIPGSTTPPPRGDAAQARAVFDAKAPARGEKPQGHGVLWITLGLVIVGVAAAGGYVWYSLEKLAPKPPLAVSRVPPPVAPPAGQPMPPPALVPPPASGQPFTPAAEPAKAEAPKPPEAPKGSPREALLSDLAKSAPPAKPPVTLAPAREAPRVPVAVASGYEALRGGDLATARRHYQSAATSDPNNLDVQLGLATVEARSGNAGAASAHYRRAPEIDPRNSAALAEGLAPGLVEARLREDASRHPDSAPLQFALGNVYASQSRWQEAQAAYFEALRADPGNPDILHNLAVSLDQLGKARLAAEHYRRALDAGRGRAAQFDAAAVNRRLDEIARAER